MGRAEKKKKKALIDFLSFTKNADISNDIRLFDGDAIFTPKLQIKDPKIIPKSILSCLSPKFITTEIKGQIENPGITRIPIEVTI